MDDNSSCHCCSDDEEEDERPLLHKVEKAESIPDAHCSDLDMLRRYRSLRKTEKINIDGEIKYIPSDALDYYNDSSRCNENNAMRRQSIRESLHYGMKMNTGIHTSIYVHNWAWHRIFHSRRSKDGTWVKLFSITCMMSQIFIPLLVIFDSHPTLSDLFVGIRNWPAISKTYHDTGWYEKHEENYYSYLSIHITVAILALTGLFSNVSDVVNQSRFYRFLHECDPVDLMLREEQRREDGLLVERQKPQKKNTRKVDKIINSSKEAGQVVGIMKKKLQQGVKGARKGAAELLSSSSGSERWKEMSFDAYDSGEESSDSIEPDDDESSPLLLSSKPGVIRRSIFEKEKKKVKQKVATSFLTRVCSVRNLSLRLVLLASMFLMLRTARFAKHIDHGTTTKLILDCLALGFVLTLDSMFDGTLAQGHTLDREIRHIFGAINFYARPVDDWIDKIIEEESHCLRMGGIVLPEFRLLPFLMFRYPYFDSEFFKKDWGEMLLDFTSPFYIIFIFYYLFLLWACI